jgi:hypothetical protein
MSDDEVLNLPGWGIPERIARARMPHEWEEEWIYGSLIAGERHLYFVNTVLVDAVDKASADRLARLAPP